MKDTGWPAFPYSYEVTPGVERHTYLGMTLRDYFAAKAMQGMLAGLDRDARRFMQREPEPAAAMAKASYAFADAMLAKRSEA